MARQHNVMSAPAPATESTTHKIVNKLSRKPPIGMMDPFWRLCDAVILHKNFNQITVGFSMEFLWEFHVGSEDLALFRFSNEFLSRK